MAQGIATFLSLPAFHTSFLGREPELTEIVQLVSDPAVRLVTLVGAGGVGKTRLAIEVAHRVGPDFDGRIIFLSFSATSDHESIIEHIARALGMTNTNEQDLPRAIAASFDRQPTLFVLDNLEHLLGQVMSIGRLLSNDGNLTVLATSRAPLEIRGEQVFFVDPFPMPGNAEHLGIDELRTLDAIRLFEERARSVQHDFQIDQANAAAVAAICRRLDGLPLAVELAASRSRMLAPAMILARLDRPLEALRSGPRDSPDRHQSLRAALSWSYELLTPEEQQLFCRLGVPRGSMSIAAIEALAVDIQLDPLEGLSSLVGKSLVQPSDTLRSDRTTTVRFQMLGTVREFALDNLAVSDDFDHAHELFAAYTGNLAATVAPEFPLGSEPDGLSLDVIGPDREPTVAILDWLHQSGRHAEMLKLTGLLAPHWFARGALRDAQVYLQLALASNVAGDPENLARATIASGMVAIQQGQFEFGERQLLAGLELARDLGAESWIGQAHFSLGVVAQDRGDPVTAKAHFERAQDLFLANEDFIFVNIAANNLGLVAGRMGNYLEGLEILDRSGRKHRALGFSFGAALADRYAGQILLELGDTVRARDALRASLRLEPEQMQGWHVANAIETIALVEARESRYQEAAVLVAGANRYREEIGVPLEPALQDGWSKLELEIAAGLSPHELDRASTHGHALALSALIAAAMAEPGAADTLTTEPPTNHLPSVTAFSLLTPRELQVLELMVAGKRNPEIGDALFISPRTVSVHVTHILEKLDVENRSAAVALALRSGIIQPGD